MTEKKKVEVLAPAGSYESMTAAFAAGADAVYIGGSRFGARAFAENLDEDMMCQAIDYAHLHGRQIYMTVNTLFKEQEIGELYHYLLPYYERGLDAVIVQDLGVMAFIRENFPDLAIHASTQMTITGVYGAKKLAKLGASRVVTARELSLEEIRQIHDQVNVEIESFVHGALCYCYSGQCLMSSVIGGRSGNRGRCAQPCRLPYEVSRDGRKLNTKDEKFVLSLKDLCTLDILPDILDAGVYSLKIEGRMKSPRYTAGVVSMYRKYVDQYLKYGKKNYRVSPADRKMLLDLFDRGGFTQGYYQEHNGRDMVAYKEKPAFREGNQELFDYLDQTYVNHMLQEPVRGTAYLEPGKEARMTLECLSAEDGEGKPISVTVSGALVQEALNQPMQKEKVIKQLGKTGNTPFFFSQLTVQINGNIFLPVQALNELRRNGLEALEKKILSGKSRSPETGQAGQISQANPLNQAAQANQAGQTSQANPLNQAAQANQAGQISQRNPAVQKEPRRDRMDGSVRKGYGTQEASVQTKIRFIASLEEENQLPPALENRDVDEIYLDADGFPADSWKAAADACHLAGKKCLLMMPHIFRTEAILYFETYCEELFQAGFDGVVVRNLEEVEWLKQTCSQVKENDLLPMVFDASLYTWNHLANQVMLDAGAFRITMPAELNSRELKAKGCAGQEIIIYGAIPMMVSAQCVRKTTEGCSRRREILYLKDRTGKQMPVKNHCTFCYNTIYNASPTVLLGQEELVNSLKPGALRMQFTTESPKEVTRCLDAFGASFLHGRRAEMPCSEYTRGHIKRGVE